MKVELIEYTHDPDRVCDIAAHNCVSESIPEAESKDFKSLTIALKSGHTSVAEHAVFTFAIEGISRACSHQLVRHRLASYCVSGDMKIRTSSEKTNNMTIKQLYEMKPQYQKQVKLRCIDERTNDIRYNSLESVTYSGVKPTYILKTIHGYEIRATKDHQFYTENGWKKLEDLKVGEKVYINGQNSYKDKDWLNQKYNVENLSQEEIGKMCGVTKYCIRSWVRKFGLQKELGIWSVGASPVNKGRTKEDYEPMRVTSQKMKGNHNPYMFKKGKEKYGSWKEDTECESTLRARTARVKYANKTGICGLCGFEGKTEIHHMNKNLKEYDTNLIELCVSCHKAIHRKEITQRIVKSEVVSIEYYGEEEVYDISMPAPNHNFIANGFVVHNCQQSQRFVKMDEMDLVVPQSIEDAIECELMNGGGWDPTGCLQEMLEGWKFRLDECIERMRKLNVPEEDIRYIFPNACKTNIVVTMNGRELLNFFTLRTCNKAQWEIRELAIEMLKLVKPVAPVLFEDAGPNCMHDCGCQEMRPCNRDVPFGAHTRVNGKIRGD